ncbi:MAG TPA: amino acid ABC transporter substrate-binding protein [Streptosporangiaceae bacterium]|jgi:branched-chain amino acid transport system substrate-binding protein|nr:amino acid ABC transporter substrate-binding protein [Streptosporangiaceae bacterium]
MEIGRQTGVRRSGRTLGIWAAGVAALAVAAAGCSSSSSSSAAGKSSAPITVGVSVSLSGDFSGDGLATKQGYETWAAYQNARGGILGRQIKLDFLSDGSSPTQVVTNYQKLITVDHVNFVLGPYSTLLTKPSSVIANRYGYVMLEGIGGGPSVFQQGLHNVFDVSASAKYQLITFAKWLAATHKPEPVAYASMTDPFLQPMLDGARAYLTAHGFTTAVYKLYPLETTDFTPIASAIAASKAPVVVLGSMPPDGYAFIQDFIQDKYDPQVLIEASGPDQGAAFVKAVGARNTGGIMVPNTWFPGSTYYQNAQMVSLYLKMFGGTANNISADVAEAFSAGQVLTQAVDHIGNTSNSALESYLHSGVTFQTVQGPVKFAADGENEAATPFVFQWQHGTLQDVLPPGVAHPVPVMAVKPAWGSGG